MIIQLDQTGHVLGYADTLAEGVTLPGGLEIDFEPDGDFYKNYFQYLYQDGKLAKDCQTVSEGQKEQIRARRQAECFPVINRGALWYKTLSPEQTASLEKWYRQWLDAPATGVIPALPADLAPRLLNQEKRS